MGTESASLKICEYCGTLSPDGPFCCSACRLLSESDWIDRAIQQKISSRHSVYCDPQVSLEFDETPAEPKARYRLSLEGLQCSSCIHLLENLPLYLPQVSKARLNFARSEFYIVTDRALNLGQALQFIDEMGYNARPLKPGSSGREISVKEDRALLGRLAIAGAMSGNIMLFTVPIYAGLAGSLHQIFNWCSFLLFLPVVFYCAIPFYKNTWGAMKLRHLSADAPLVIALWAGFLASTYNLVRGRGELYFDSTAGFIFLILISRWFLKTSQRRWLAGPAFDSPWMREVVDVLNEDGSRSKRLSSDLKSGERFLLLPQQILAVDAWLESDKADFDTSWMTGEPLPRICLRGMRLPAGYRCLSSPVELRAATSAEDSELARSLRKIEIDAAVHRQNLGLFESSARNLLAVVLGLGVLLCVLGPLIFGLNLEDSFQRALSLLIVACPCALAFGGPLAYGMALRKAAQKGILIRGPDVLDRVAQCRQFIFDKTGTLTLGKLKLVAQIPAALPDWIQNLILNLEKNSNHPVADAFRSAWSVRPMKNLDVRDITEITGEKIFGLFQGQVYSLQSHHGNNSSLEISLLKNEQKIATFCFEDELRPETKSILKKLSKKYNLRILSGDRNPRVQNLIQQLQIPGLMGWGDQRPSQKADRVREMFPALMIGDGYNDGEALSAAHVGVAMNGSIGHGLNQGQVYFLKPGLFPLVELLEASFRARRIVRINLSFALAYNLGAGAAAILGFINPLTAALLMPISSILILASSWGASK